MKLIPAGRPTWAKVDLSALCWNYRQVEKMMHPGVKILAVVKANAYGHGAVACGRVLAQCGAAALGVASVEEALELRAAGVRTPIMIFGITQPQEAPAIVAARLEPTVVLPRQLQALARAARKARRPMRVHLKVDTGMGRIGIAPEAASAWLAAFRRHTPALQLAGIYTHFAHADGRDRTLVHDQYQRLMKVAEMAREKGWNNFLVHAANSAAVIEAPEVHADMVRPGLMLYGLSPAPRFHKRVQLKPVLSWITRIVQLKTVPAGTGLSYGHTFITRRPSRIATLAIGYADGFFRGFSNRGEVLIRGQRAPIVGRVCMDMCLADVTRIPLVRLGDEAVLIGRQGDAQLLADDLARWQNTISYEVVCAVGKRVPRVYSGGGQ